MPLVKRAPSLVGNAALLLAVTSIGTAVLAFGGVHAFWVAVAAGLAHLSLALHVVSRARTRRPVSTSWLGLPLAVGLGLTLFELTPLPLFLRELLSPGGTERTLFVTSALSDEARGLVRSVLSLDPPETALAALRLSAALAVFVVIADRCRSSSGQKLAFRALLALGALLLVVGLGHWVLSLPTIYGVHPRYGGWFSSPFINPNHGARAYGALSLLLVGRAFLARARHEAAAFAFVGGALGVCSLLIPSRGGTLAYVAALGLLLWWSARARRQELEGHDESKRRLAPRALLTLQLLGVGLAGALLMAGKEVLEQLFPVEEGDVSALGKFVLYGPTLDAVREYWRAGAGNNAFQSALPPTLEIGELWEAASISHAENVVLQVLVDHGVLFGGALLLLGVGVAATLLMGSARPGIVPGLATLAFLVVGDFVDFSLEVGFGVLLAACALGLCASALLSEDIARVRVPARAALPLVVAIGGVAVWTTSMAIPDERFTTDRMLTALEGPERRTRLERAMARHPSDAHYAYSLSVDARQRKDLKGALSWANRSLILWPGHPGAHVEAARALAALGRLEQALLEYQLAWRSGANKSELLKEVAARTKDPLLRRRAVPDDDPAALAFVCRVLVKERRFDDADPCYGDAAAMEGASEDVWLEWVRNALRREDAKAAKERVERYAKVRVVDGEMASLSAQADAFLKGPERAFASSAALAKELRNPGPLQKWRFHTARSLGDTTGARKILEELRRHLKEPKDRDWLDRQEAMLLAEIGEHAEALDRWRRVSRRAPRDLKAALAQGELELTLGLIDEAERTWRRARGIAPENRQVRQLGERIDAAQRSKHEDRLRGILERSGASER